MGEHAHRSRSCCGTGLGVGAIVLVIALTFAASAAAKTRVVHNTHNAGPGSLRRTVAHAHPGDHIRVPKGTYELRSGEIRIAEALKIIGAGSGRTKITANRHSRIFELTSAASPVQISGLKLTGGKATEGGAILNAGSLSLDQVELSGNRASSRNSASGGAISTSGGLNIDRSLLRGNRAASTGSYEAFGGAIAAVSGTSDTVQVLHSQLLDNRADGDGLGGAIAFEPISQPTNSGLVISKSTISGNEATGTSGASRAYGGAIAFEAIDDVGVQIPLVITKSTISGNSARPFGGDHSFGGGIFFEPVLNEGASQIPLIVISSTIAGNKALGSGSLGGGIFESAVANSGSSSIKNLFEDTIAGNSAPDGSGGGIWFASGAAVFEPVPNFVRTIDAANSSGVPGTSDCNDAATSNGFNLESHVSCGFTAAGDLQNRNPKLLPLRDNGGPTKTKGLKHSSPALDGAGNVCLAHDQRGEPRPGGSACDIGAFELQP